MVRRLLICASLVAGVLVTTAPAVAGATPERATFDNYMEADAGPLCDFPVTVRAHTWGWYEFWADGDVWLMEEDHYWEQDTIAGPGGSLTSEPYRLNTSARFGPEPGSITKAVSTGGIGRFILPDGSVFWSAGRIDWLTHTTAVYVPDQGRHSDTSGLCAAID